MRPTEETHDFKSELRDVADEQRLAYNWSRIEERRRGRPIVSDRLVFAAGGLVAAFAVILAAILFFKPDSSNTQKPLVLTLSEWTPSMAVPSYAAKEKKVTLSDGSCLTLAPGASLEVKENSAEKFETLLQKGWVRFNVIPGQGRTWVIDVGEGRIVVLGTQFTVNRTSSAVKVTVHRGTVALFRSPSDNEGIKISVGESGQLAVPGAPVQVALNAAVPNERVSSPVAPQPPGASTHPLKRAFAKPKATLNAAQDGRSAALKFASTDLAGLSSSRPVNALLKQVDDARRRRQHEEAARLLERILKEYPSDPAFGLAALTLGKIRLDSLHKPRSAASAFKQATEFKGLPSPLREQAFAGCVEAFHLAGDDSAALSMKNLYKSRFPGGTWLEWMENRININE